MNCVKCGREVYDGGDTCIFHCEKEGWNNIEIIKFQNKIKELKFQTENILDEFIFPTEILDTFIKGRTYYNNVIFKDSIKIDNKTFKEKLIFKNCTFEKPLSFKSCIFEKELKFENTTIKNSMNFKNSKFEFKAYFFNLKEIKLINFKDVIFNELKINNNYNDSKIYFINVEFYDNFKLYNNYFNELKFQESIFTKYSSIKFKSSSFNHFIIDTCGNYTSQISFNELFIQKEFILQKTDFKNKVFNNLNLSNARVKIDIEQNINIFELIHWGNIHNKRIKINKKFLKVLKTYAKKDNNIVDETAFHSIEMYMIKEEYYQKLQKEPNILKKVIYFFKNILLLELYEKTSNYSENWIQPIWLLIIFSIFSYLLHIYSIITIFIIIYILIFTSLHSYRFKYKSNLLFTISVMMIVLYIFTEYLNFSSQNLLEYMNPLHKSNKEQITIWNHIRNFVVVVLGSRIFLAIKARNYYK